MKKLLLLTLISVFTLSAIAQDDTDVRDPKAKKILDQVSAKTKSYKNIKAVFTYSLDNNEEDMHDTQEGEIIMKGEKYNLKMAGQEIIFDGKYVWVLLREDEEATKSLPDKGGLSPADMFNVYEEGWKFKYIKQVTENGVTLEVIDLVPKEGDKAFSRVRLLIDQSKSRIVSAKFFGKDGTFYTYTLKDMKVNIELNEKAFTFTSAQYPDWEVTDLTED